MQKYISFQRKQYQTERKCIMREIFLQYLFKNLRVRKKKHFCYNANKKKRLVKL